MSDRQSAITKLIGELHSINEEKMNSEPWTCEQICNRAALAMGLMQKELLAVQQAPNAKEG